MGTRARKKPGRPLANPAEGVKDKVIVMRTTEETHRRLHEAAAAKGKSLTEWLIGLGLSAARRQRTGAKEAEPER